ncbi:hypothetical protein [Pyruvatibacter sp.]
MKTTLLVDADLYAFRAMSAAEEEEEWDDDVWTLTCDHKKAREMYFASVARAERLTGAEHIVHCFSDSTNWRKTLNPSYKANRKKVRKPVGYLEFVAKLQKDVAKAYVRPTLEADDILGILSTHPTLISGRKVIASLDKDMKTIPGWLFDGEDVYEVTPEAAERYHMSQTLSGDAVDNYPGCPGMGKQRAEEAVSPPTMLVPYEHELKRGPRKGQTETRYTEEPTDDLWAAVVSRFVAAGQTEEDALLNARLARICQYTDYDFKKKEVILWQPS